jgi:two-component system chemotaxis sensor kinase CheA
MDEDLKILSQYSRPLISILSYYNSELEGKNFLDILSVSLNAKQLQILQGYFSMIFSKAKSAKVLESANPISEFEYKTGDRVKILSTRFQLIEQADSEPLIIVIIQDITREKEFEKELQTQREAQELEMKNLFDVIQIDPMVFHDFIEDTEFHFNYINSILKDKSLTEKQVVTKFFQNIHAIKSNALILGLESFGMKLHALEEDIKDVSALQEITTNDILSLAVKLELIMQDKDSYSTIVKKIEAYKSSNQIDSVLINSLNRAVERISSETKRKVELKAGQLNMDILESKLRKPIKDILFQCIRNAIYHGIESVEERIRKNKNPHGLLVFSIRKVDGMAEVIFSDDGCGLDWEKIKKKYIEIYPDTKNVSRNILLSSIFSPEFSTIDVANAVAGRGVGLSLVKDLVKENHGNINVNSTESGLTLKFVFPLSA